MDRLVKILLLTDFSSGYSRDLLKGMVAFAQAQKNWTFYRIPLYYRMMRGEEEILKWARKWQVDAIVAQLNDIDLSRLKDLNLPVIVQNYRDRIPGICNLTGDYVGTGRMAAEYFINLGYRHFAYYGTEEAIWSRERYEGFRKTLEEHGFEVSSCFETASDTAPWEQDAAKLNLWLKSLPENTALMACDDQHALHITETCKMLEIRIPDRIAVLGVDNDPLLCNISDPPLTSIMIDARKGGYMAAQALKELMDRHSENAFNISVPPLQVITRGSTKKWIVSDRHILKTIEYIEANYASPISVELLLNLVPFSRRVFEKKFKEETGFAVYRFILKYRVDKFAEKLLTDDGPIENIGISCGFRNGQNLSRVFRQLKGMSPSEFRDKKIGNNLGGNRWFPEQ